MALQFHKRSIAVAAKGRLGGANLVLGHFGYENNQLDGQTVKTRAMLSLLKKNLANTLYFDTGRLTRDRRAIFSLVPLLLRTRRVFFLPSYRSLSRVFPPLFFLSQICRFKIYYVVIGGGILKFLEHRPLHRAMLAKIEAVLPENRYICNQLRGNYGFRNVSVMYNFRDGRQITVNRNLAVNQQDIRLVFMSRINKAKGFEAVFELAEVLKDKLHVTIDFYGPIQKNDELCFLEGIEAHPNTRYKGVLEPADITSVLSTYDVLLLPTKYYTEGLPGALIDAYFSGLTVIASDWQNAREFIRHGETGLIYRWDDVQDFVSQVSELIGSPDEIERLKRNARHEVKKYTSETAWATLAGTLQ